MRLVALAALTALTALSCGRTAEPASAAFPCEVDFGAAKCDDLAKERRDLAKTYVKEVTQERKKVDFDRADSIAACEQRVIDEQLSRACFAKVEDRCTPLCELHPCPLKAGIVASCVGACGAVVADGDTKVSADDIDLALQIAAENPGLCTCQPCDAGKTKNVCETLWDCK
jgi:hypothetical protein